MDVFPVLWALRFSKTLDPIEAIVWWASMIKQVDKNLIYFVRLSDLEGDLAVCIANGSLEYPPVEEAHQLALDMMDNWIENSWEGENA